MDTILALAIHSIPNLNGKERLDLAELCHDPPVFQKFKGLDIFKINSIKETPKRIENFKNFDGLKVFNSCEKLYEKLQKRNIKITHLHAKNYPPLLREINDPPFLLFYKGDLPNPEQPCLGVVGTRKATPTGKNETAILVREVAPYIASIVSGLALGIDSAAHRAALSVKAHTLAVMGGGFDHIYPKSNLKLAGDIISKGGAILTEYFPAIQPTKFSFPIRNRIIAGISRAVLVIEAPHRSGALSTAHHANDEGRDVFIHRIGLQHLGGTWKLYQNGVSVIERGAELLASWGIDTQIPPLEEESTTPILPQIQEQPPKKHSTKSFTYDINKILAEETARDIGLS